MPLSPQDASARARDICRFAPVVPVLVVDDIAHARPLAEALVAGGLPALEVTLRTPAALDVVREMAQVKGGVVGAGTLITPADVRAAKDAGASVRYIEFRKSDCTLDLLDLQAKLGARTKLVAVGAAANATGTINPIEDISKMVHEAGALLYVDAVHYAPHRLMDAKAWGADFVVCSAYKFFGPHVGALWGRRALLEVLPAYQVRPAADALPERWMTGTPSLEGIAGVRAAVDYLASLGEGATRRAKLDSAYQAIRTHEDRLTLALLDGLESIDGVRVLGVTDRARLAERVPTVAIVHDHHKSQSIAEKLAARGIFVWHGHFYALAMSEALGLEPDGMVRIGLLHYNTEQEVSRLIEALRAL